MDGGGGHTYLEVPVDHPHLVTVQDSLQDLLDAVAACKWEGSEVGCPLLAYHLHPQTSPCPSAPGGIDKNEWWPWICVLENPSVPLPGGAAPGHHPWGVTQRGYPWGQPHLGWLIA